MSAEFVAAMEDVLDLYEQPYDPQRPTVCFDETSTQLIGESRIPLPARPGRRERFDYEYRRNGTRNLFMLCEPLRGWRHVAVTERRRMGDFAYQMRWLADEAYTKAEKIRVVLDNLNTHRPASLYETFDPAEARRILKRLEFHYLEGFLRVACPGDFPPGKLLGPFIEECRHKFGDPGEVLSKDIAQELHGIVEYCNRFHHDTLPAWTAEDINATELLSFVQRTLTFVGPPIKMSHTCS